MEQVYNESLDQNSYGIPNHNQRRSEFLDNYSQQEDHNNNNPTNSFNDSNLVCRDGGNQLYGINIDTNSTDNKINNQVAAKKSNQIIKDIIFYYKKAFGQIYDLKEFLNKKWYSLLLQYEIPSMFNNTPNLLSITPLEYITNILKNKKRKKKGKNNINLEEAKNVLKFFKKILDKNDDEVKSQNDSFLDMNDNFDNNIEFENPEYFKHPLIELEEEEEEENRINCSDEENIENNQIKGNRIDNLFDRLKTMIQIFFIFIFNSLVKDEYKIPERINNCLNKIKSKSNYIKFMQSSFKNNLTYFTKEDKKSNKFEYISNIIQKIELNPENNKEAINLLNKTPLVLLKEILRNKEQRQKFFKLDIDMVLSRIKNRKCRNIVNKSQELKNIKGLVWKNNIYTKIKDANKFKEKVNKLKNYENFSLDLTEDETKKIEERNIILKNLAENPMTYLLLIKGRKERKKGTIFCIGK